MTHGNGVSRGDRNRNARLTRLRAAVPVTNAIVGVDLADRKQMVVVCDHDSKVLARKTFRCRAWDLRNRSRPVDPLLAEQLRRHCWRDRASEHQRLYAMPAQ